MINKDFLMGYGAGKAFGGGGIDLNHAQTIDGTLANPWGDMTTDEIHALSKKLAHGNASIYHLRIFFSGTEYEEIDYADLLGGQTGTMEFSFAFVNANAVFAVYVFYDDYNGNYYRLTSAYMQYNGEIIDLSEYAETLETTLVIEYHPMTQS